LRLDDFFNPRGERTRIACHPAASIGFPGQGIRDRLLDDRCTRRSRPGSRTFSDPAGFSINELFMHRTCAPRFTSHRRAVLQHAVPVPGSPLALVAAALE